MRAENFKMDPDQMARWSEPLVADYIFVEYERLLGEGESLAEQLARQHCRVWRDLLANDTRRAQVSRRDLLHLARVAGVSADMIEAIDATIFDALLDVILRRGNGARARALNDGHALMAAASTLGEIRHAA